MREDRERSHEDKASIRMERPRDVLAENLRKLMAATPSLSNPKKLIAAGAASNGTLDRMRRAKANIGVDYLEPLAQAFGLQPWQLLVPDLVVTTGHDGMPVVANAHWPFPAVDRSRFYALSEADRGYVQRRLIQAIADCEVPSASHLDTPAPGSLQAEPSGKAGNETTGSRTKGRSA